MSRCDQSEDCSDGSDEASCRIVEVEREKYLKDKQPGIGVEVEVDLKISKILLIDEVQLKKAQCKTLHL